MTPPPAARREKRRTKMRSMTGKGTMEMMATKMTVATNTMVALISSF